MWGRLNNCTHGVNWTQSEFIQSSRYSLVPFIVSVSVWVHSVTWRWPGPGRAAEAARVRSTWPRGWAARPSGSSPGEGIVARWRNQWHLQHWRCPGGLTCRGVESISCVVFFPSRGEKLARRRSGVRCIWGRSRP